MSKSESWPKGALTREQVRPRIGYPGRLYLVYNSPGRNGYPTFHKINPAEYKLSYEPEGVWLDPIADLPDNLNYKIFLPHKSKRCDSDRERYVFDNFWFAQAYIAKIRQTTIDRLSA